MIWRLKYLSILLGAVLVVPADKIFAQTDILDVTVEIYYISDENDETDTDGGAPLPAGSITYRVFLQLAQGAKLRSIYGDATNQLKIQSTALFFNNEDRGQLFGHQIQNNRLGDNTVALDSWLSFGAASNAHYGVLKSADNNGSIIGGINNDGGSENIPGGLLANDDPLAGTPLTVQDGLIPGSNLTPQNFTVVGDSPANAFGNSTMESSFVSNSFNVVSANGVEGSSSENKILIAQLTTTGELSFELNVEVINAQGALFKYVAQNTGQGSNVTISSWLTYPPQCGCTNPDYLEYDAIAGCDDGSCMTLVQLGCADMAACNYDPEANFNVPGLCCYSVDDCNGLDVSIVCPTLTSDEKISHEYLRIYPNPTDQAITVELANSVVNTYEIAIFDMMGKIKLIQQGSGNSEGLYQNLYLGNLPPGTYIMRISDDTTYIYSRFVKR